MLSDRLAVKGIQILRCLMGALFLYSALVKLRDPHAFAENILHYRILEGPLVAWLAWGIPWMELYCGASLLLLAPFRKASWIWIKVMLLLFTVAKLSAVLRGLDVSCGCFGGDQPVGWGSVGINLLLSFLATLGLVLDRRRHPVS